jgi:recombination protein RecA
MDENKLRALQFAVSQIEKSHGKGAIMKMGDKPVEAVKTISSGALS